MSSTYSHSGRNTPMEQRIYTLSNVNSEETISTTSIKPSLNPAVPRIQILLAPYMSPYVVPVHKVKTWESLHKTLASLFGTNVFNGKPARITDATGNTILPALWKDFLEPNMTIIVDTCAYIPESSVAMFDLSRHHRRKSSGSTKRSRGKYMSANTLVESEESSYENAPTTSPLGHIGQAALLAPPNSLKTRPVQHPWEGLKTNLTSPDEKRNTTVSMFVGRSKVDHNITVKPLVIEKNATTQPSAPPPPPPKSVTLDYDSTVETENSVWETEKPEKKKAKSKSGWARITRALLYVLSAGNSHHSNGNNQSDHSKPESSHWHTASPRKTYSAPMRKRRGAASPPSHRRSRSLSSFQSRPLQSSPPPVKHQPNKLHRSQSERKGTINHNNRGLLPHSPSLNQQQCVISPPIPRRPSVGLGLNAQFAIPESLEQLQEMMQDRLNGGTRSRSGTASSLPTTPPFRFNAFPPLQSPPLPPPKPPALSGTDRRPKYASARRVAPAPA